MAGEKFIYGNNPYLDIGYFQNLAQNAGGRDYLTRYAKSGLKAFARGDDVSSYGELNSISQNAAGARQRALEGGGTGAGLLMSAQGGEQEGLQRSITNKAVQQVNQQEGMDKVNALTGLQNQWANQFQSGLGREQQAQQFANSLYLQALGMKYPAAYDPYHRSFGQDIGQMAIGAALGAGGGYGKQQGWWG